MKTRSPYDRDDLSIGKKDKVVEIGSGQNPNYRSNILVEKYIGNNYHRGGDIKIYPHQKLINADGHATPFKDKEFDYAICCQVLEHAEDPEAFLKEQFRIAKRGYIETPSLLGETLFPKKSHKWVILDIDGKLVLFEKSKMLENYKNDYGVLFINYLPYQSLVYKILCITEGSIMINRYEWKDTIEFIVNPTDEYYRSFFLQPWNKTMVEKLFPRRSIFTEITKIIKASWYLTKYKIKKYIYRKHGFLTLDEYMELNNKF